MTKMLEKAFAEAARLPEQEQNAFATWILKELASEERWQKAFASSADALASLADEALEEHRKEIRGRLIPTGYEISHHGTFPQGVRAFTATRPASSARGI